jgi:hypothetical protein
MVSFVRKFEEQQRILASEKQSRTPILAAQILIKDIMGSTYPQLSEPQDDDTGPAAKLYRRRYQHIKDTLKHSRHWKRLVEEFGYGILGLLTSGGEYEVTNTTVNVMNNQVFHIFVERLKREKGEFLKGVSSAITVLLQKAIQGPLDASVPRLLLENAEPMEIMRYADQSEDLVRLTSPISE